MTKVAGILITFSACGSAWLFWDAGQPNAYLQSVRGISPPHPYEWEYPAIFIAAMLVCACVLRVWNDSHPAVYAMLAFVCLFAMSFYFFMTSMHSPPAQAALSMALFVAALLALFYAGFCVGVATRKQPQK